MEPGTMMPGILIDDLRKGAKLRQSFPGASEELE